MRLHLCNRPLLRRAILALALPVCALMACPGRPSGSDRILFKATYGQDAYPDLGWGANESKFLDQRFTRAYLPTGGPAGGPAVRLAARHCADCSSSGGQYNWGWRANITPDDPPAGTSRFYRWRMRFTPDSNHRGLDWGDGHRTGPQNKLLIVGQDCGRGCRFILTYQTEPDRPEIRNFRLQKDGGEDLDDSRGFPIGEWLHVQVELALGDAKGKGGAYRLWINSHDQKRPSAERRDITLHGNNHRYVWFGAFMNDGLARDGVHAWDHTDFEVGTTYDPAWGPEGAATKPRP